jgi:2-oxoglutarate ferredoxin oxidoreductase subunit alpha
MMDRLKAKYETAKSFLPKPEIKKIRGANIGIIAFGSTEPAIAEAQHLLNKEHGIKADSLRLRAIPFTDEVEEFVKKHDTLYVVELNRDGQLNQLLTIAYPDHATKLNSIAHSDGLSATAKWVVNAIVAKEEK